MVRDSDISWVSSRLMLINLDCSLKLMSNTTWTADFYALKCITDTILGPVVQSVVSLTSSLVVKLLTVLVSTISNS